MLTCSSCQEETNSLKNNLCSPCWCETQAERYRCRECDRWACVKEYREDALKDGHCFTCTFWLQKVDWENEKNPNAVRINGTHYLIAKDSSNPGWGCGFGGTKFIIKFFDGREVETRNLWCQGNIPEKFKARLPDNAHK